MKQERISDTLEKSGTDPMLVSVVRGMEDTIEEQKQTIERLMPKAKAYEMFAGAVNMVTNGPDKGEA